MNEINNLETGWLSKIIASPVYYKTFLTIYLALNEDYEIVNFFSEVGGFSQEQVVYYYEPTDTYKILSIAWIDIGDSSNRYP